MLLKLLAPSIVQISLPGIGDWAGVGRAKAEGKGGPRTWPAAIHLASGHPLPKAEVAGEGETSPPTRLTQGLLRGSDSLEADSATRRLHATAAPPQPRGLAHASSKLLLPATVLLWLLGTGVWWLRIGLSLARFGQLMKLAEPAKAEVRARAGAIAERIGLRMVPTVWMLPARVSPMVSVGFRGQPRVILPEELWGRLEPEQQDTVLAHELAHLKRRDHWVRRLEAAVLGLYWWDPIAWWARREIEHAEEHCCDAWAVRAVPGAGGAYALALVATAAFLAGERRALPAGACGVGRLVPLKRRLQMVVNDSGSASHSLRAPRVLLILGVAGLMLLPAPLRSAPAGAAGSTFINQRGAARHATADRANRDQGRGVTIEGRTAAAARRPGFQQAGGARHAPGHARDR